MTKHRGGWKCEVTTRGVLRWSGFIGTRHAERNTYPDGTMIYEVEMSAGCGLQQLPEDERELRGRIDTAIRVARGSREPRHNFPGGETM